MPLQSGDKLGPYEILTLIGKGGMEAYKAATSASMASSPSSNSGASGRG